MHLVEMRPIKYDLSGGLLMLFSLSFSASISTGQWHSFRGVPLPKAMVRVLSALSELVESAPFQVVSLPQRPPPCRA
jgi:hypothetical protein